ncbi:MAG: hypothetical protein KKA73_21940 [Chloroflexi bacterium]|nr:hypothetical protein [Chloroflexota bacterium]MBU1750355.1 hypothetical protein [Chloroflexota bacterium]
MEEFIFGTLANDELKLIHHRAARSGLQHGHDLAPRDPEPGQPVTVTVSLGPGLSADHVACYYTLDGSEPAGARGVVSSGHQGQVLWLQPRDTVWDTLVWGYISRWQGVLPAQPSGTLVRYRLGAWTDAGPEVWADWPDVQSTVEQSAAAFFRGESLPSPPQEGGPRGGRVASAIPLHTAWITWDHRSGRARPSSTRSL